MGTYNSTYTSIVTLSAAPPNATLSATGVINAYGPAGVYIIDNNNTLTPETLSAALFGPAGTAFTITNAGLIESHGGNPNNWFDAGIVLGAPGTVTNDGTIKGAAGVFMFGASNSSGAVVDNAGLIVGSISAGIFLGTSGRVVNSGSISGVKSGVIDQNNQPSYFSNASTGVISSSGGYAIEAQGGGTVLNAGLLTGFYGGLHLGGAGDNTLINSGSIASTAGAPGTYGGYAAVNINEYNSISQTLVITNSSSGKITGEYGIRISQNGYNSYSNAGLAVNNITNAGTILGSLYSAIADQIGVATLHNSGLIATTIHAAETNGSNAGVQFNFGGVVYNSFGGSIAGDWGIELGTGTVFNAGSIAGATAPSGTFGNYAAIYIQNGGDVHNTITGHITGASGIRINGNGTNDVKNNGFIGASKGAGVYFYQNGTVVNTGTILGPHHAIVTGGANGFATGTINNSGLIESSSNTFTNSSGTHAGSGIALLGGGEITNQSTGIIIGANGVYGSAGSGGIVIGNAGLITGTYKSGIVLATGGYISNSGSIGGARDGIDLKAGGTVVDSGTISGATNAIYFGPGNSRLVIEAGANIIGSVTAAYSDLSTSFLELGSAGSQGSFNMGGTVNGFNYINFDSGQDWTLEGNISELGNNTVGINGFTIGDTLILTGFTATSDVFNTGSDVLSLSNGASIDQLTFYDSYENSEFHITSVAAGTEITLMELCYLRGTNILTPTGARKVEALRPGDEIITRRSGVAKLKWIGRQNYAGPFLARNPEKLPVRILPGALGTGLPRRDLFVSPGHSLLLGETLVLAKDLVNGVTILQDEAPALVEYYALELHGHDCVIAEGVFAESFADGPGLRNQFHNVADFYKAFPDYAEPDELALCAPRPQHGPLLEAALRPILARAAKLAAPGALRGWVEHAGADGRIEGWAQDTANPELPVRLEIRAGGVCLGTVLAREFRGDLAAAGIGKGRAMFSFNAPAGLNITVHRADDGAMLPFTSDCQQRLAG